MTPSLHRPVQLRVKQPLVEGIAVNAFPRVTSEVESL